MTWTGKNFVAGDILTATQMNNLQADITAQANGDSSAPRQTLASMDALSVGESQILAAAVSQGKLNTAMSAVSTSAASALLTLPGGEYGFYPQTHSSSSSTHGMEITGSVGSSAYLTRITITRNSGGGSGFAQQRYVQASPPYDLGDGQIPLFIFLLIRNSDKKILATCIAPEAPWHLNGPTIIRPDFYRDGQPYRRIREIPESLISAKAEIDSIRQKLRDNGIITDSDRMAMRDFYEGMKEAKMVGLKITQGIKQADMGLLPHPFLGNNFPGSTVLLLDPLNIITRDLSELIDEEGVAFEITNLFYNGFFKISNVPLVRAGPDGVMQVSYTWR